eukprot:15004725-Alexandrium_andersonii.AAC.1
MKPHTGDDNLREGYASAARQSGNAVADMLTEEGRGMQREGVASPPSFLTKRAAEHAAYAHA